MRICSWNMQTSNGIQDMCIEYERDTLEVGVWVHVYLEKYIWKIIPKYANTSYTVSLPEIGVVYCVYFLYNVRY